MKKLNLKSKLNNLLAWFKRSRDYDVTKRAPRPYRDWRRLMLGWFAGLLVLLLVAGYLQWSLRRNRETNKDGSVSVSTPGLTQAQLNKAHSVVNERAARFNQVSQTPPVLIDPAL